MDEFIEPMFFCALCLLTYAIVKRSFLVAIIAILLIAVGCVQFKVLMDEDELQRKRNDIESEYACHISAKKLPDPLPSPFGKMHKPDNCCDFFCDCPIKRSDLVDAEMLTCPCGHPTSWHFDY